MQGSTHKIHLVKETFLQKSSTYSRRNRVKKAALPGDGLSCSFCFVGMLRQRGTSIHSETYLIYKYLQSSRKKNPPNFEKLIAGPLIVQYIAPSYFSWCYATLRDKLPCKYCTPWKCTLLHFRITGHLFIHYGLPLV